MTGSTMDNIDIDLYEPWMHDQVVRMICQEYGYREEDPNRAIKNLYEHPYQKDKSILLVALDGKKVVGFQSYFYWPYLLDGKIMNVYQSGNSLVASSYRGRGVFRRLLGYLNVAFEDKQIDFLIGFPISGSYNSLIRNGWSNILNINWYIKVINPFSLLKKFDITKLSMENKPQRISNIPRQDGFTLNRDPDFEAWRKTYSKNNYYLYFHFDVGSSHVRFDLKINFRDKIKELIIGRVHNNSESKDFLVAAVKALVKEVRVQRIFTFISIAINEHYYDNAILEAFKHVGFRRIKKEIYFTVKDHVLGEKLFRPELWELYRSDIDTW